jgi:hypothetical protein
MAGLARPVACALALALCADARAAAATNPPESERIASENEAGGAAVPKVGFTMLAGVALPTCNGQTESCAGSLGAGPSLQALVLFRPTKMWSFGVMGQLARSHWRATYLGMVDGATHGVDSDLTTGLVGFTTRIVLLPGRLVSPVVQLALGGAFQTQTGLNFGCNGGLYPTGQVGLGAKARINRSFAVFALASASDGTKLGDCAVSDGAPATPFAGWGYGLLVGGSFDVLPGGASGTASLAAR